MRGVVTQTYVDLCRSLPCVWAGRCRSTGSPTGKVGKVLGPRYHEGPFLNLNAGEHH